MKVLSTTPVPSCSDRARTESAPGYYQSTANESFIVISMGDGDAGTSSVHILSSRDGVLAPKQPPRDFIGGAKLMVVLLDGENLVVTWAKSPILTVYNIPSGYVPLPSNTTR